MNDKPLLVGKAYHIRDERPNGFVGIAILREINPPNDQALAQPGRKETL